MRKFALLHSDPFVFVIILHVFTFFALTTVPFIHSVGFFSVFFELPTDSFKPFDLSLYKLGPRGSRPSRVHSCEKEIKGAIESKALKP